MKIRTLIAILLMPLLAGTAFAFFDPTGPVQRAMMIANQVTMIANQSIQIAEMGAQLTKLTEQFQHLKEQAMGTVGAITDPFTDLASQSTGLISSGLTWKDDFTGEAREIARAVEDMGTIGTSFSQTWRPQLQAADQVSEQDILALFTNHPPATGTHASENYNNARERADKRLVFDHALSDAAAELTNAVRSAVDSYKGLRNNANTSHTALQQAVVAGQVTQGQLVAAMAQLTAYQAAAQAAEDYEREIDRRRALAAQVEAQRRAQANFQAQQAGLDARRNAMREGQLIRVHPFYRGN